VVEGADTYSQSRSPPNEVRSGVFDVGAGDRRAVSGADGIRRRVCPSACVASRRDLGTKPPSRLTCLGKLRPPLSSIRVGPDPALAPVRKRHRWPIDVALTTSMAHRCRMTRARRAVPRRRSGWWGRGERAGGQQVRPTVWFLGGTGRSCPRSPVEFTAAGTPLNGEPFGNTYRSVEYA
jgi:hypothetical protein